jgi:hypothetical protein
MTTWDCIWRVSTFGAIGGLVACFHKDSVFLPKFNKTSKVWTPGSVGTILVGAFAAFLIWCLYGSAASFDIGTIPKEHSISLTFRELGNSSLVGFIGGKVLTLLAQKNADQVASQDLSKLLKNLLENQKK